MKVQYNSDLGFFDGLVNGKVYEVIQNLETQYLVKNELDGTSAIKKDKFIIIEQ